ncbi:unnamed protein product [Vitrella brassicaformis CCMP3155]|uniref:Uncharacterized protein n=1 Tax=Vitrella brassicaformis (strain CCMP3155) TaxID=1169540 RepID=A0A0G4F0T3_VITBC|nr:unnamed protein product [Vitrella brassicaformis CCMP3155]|eukprot:CEM05231.1 unnamed protein product [Vitrella brassicaformis CCMP3155]
MQLGSIFYASFSSVLQVFLLCSPGFLLAYFPRKAPILSRGLLQELSRLSMLLFLPCMCFVSLASTVDVRELEALWPIVLWSLVTLLTNHLTAVALIALWRTRVRELPKATTSCAVTCLTFQNGINFLLPLMRALCQTSDALGEWAGSADSCEDEADSLLFIHGIPWFFVFWLHGMPALESLAALSRRAAAAASLSDGQSSPDGCASVNEATKLPLCRAASEPPPVLPIQHTKSVPPPSTWRPDHTQAPHFPAGPSTDSCTQDAAETIDIVPSNSSKNGDRDGDSGDEEEEEEQQRQQRCPGAAGKRHYLFPPALNRLRHPAIIATILGLLMGLWRDFQVSMFEDTSSFLSVFGRVGRLIAEPTVTLMSLILAASLAHGVQHDTGRSNKDSRHQQSGRPQCLSPEALFVVFCSGIKLVVVPMVGCGMLVLLEYLHSAGYGSWVRTLVPDSPVFKLVLLLEFCAPPALALSVVSNQLGLREEADFLSKLLFWMYLLSLVTATLFCSLALALLV